MARWEILAVLPLLTYAGCGGLSRIFMNSPWRACWQQPDAVIGALSIRPGDHIADLGAGGGYFTFRLADAVGPAGKVYAVDIDKGSLDSIARRAQEQGYANVETILATYDDPLLPQSGIDLIFTCNTYHHLENHAAYFASAARYLRPDGRVAIIDLAGMNWLFRLLGHWTPKETIRSEMEIGGYQLVSGFDLLSRQNFQVFALHSQGGKS